MKNKRERQEFVVPRRIQSTLRVFLNLLAVDAFAHSSVRGARKTKAGASECARREREKWASWRTKDKRCVRSRLFSMGSAFILSSFAGQKDWQICVLKTHPSRKRERKEKEEISIKSLFCYTP